MGKIAKAIGLAIIGGLVISFFIFIAPLLPLSEEEPTFDIHDEIANLNAERKSWDNYHILEYDWLVWSRQFEATGSVFIEMYSWGEFQESLKQNSFVYVLMLDENHRVIWYRTSFSSGVYYNY